MYIVYTELQQKFNVNGGFILLNEVMSDTYLAASGLVNFEPLQDSCWIFWDFSEYSQNSH